MEEKEFVVFEVTAKDGTTVTMAVVDEFDFENKHYIAASRVVDDTVSDEGVYIYRAKITDDDFVAEKIMNAIEYEKVVTAYTEME